DLRLGDLLRSCGRLGRRRERGGRERERVAPRFATTPATTEVAPDIGAATHCAALCEAIGRLATPASRRRRSRVATHTSARCRRLSVHRLAELGLLGYWWFELDLATDLTTLSVLRGHFRLRSRRGNWNWRLLDRPNPAPFQLRLVVFAWCRDDSTLFGFDLM